MATVKKIILFVWKGFKVLCFVTGCCVLAGIAYIIIDHATQQPEWPSKFEALAPAAEVEVLQRDSDEFEDRYIIRIRNADVRAHMIEEILRRNKNARQDEYGYLNPDMSLRQRFKEEYGNGDNYVFRLYAECPYPGHHRRDYMVVTEGRDGTFFVAANVL